MSYQLFVSVNRTPPAGDRDWVVVRSYAQAVSTMSVLGVPEYISIDFDLGSGPSGADLAFWMIQSHEERRLRFPVIFDYHLQADDVDDISEAVAEMEWFLEVESNRKTQVRIPQPDGVAWQQHAIRPL